VAVLVAAVVAAVVVAVDDTAITVSGLLAFTQTPSRFQHGLEGVFIFRVACGEGGQTGVVEVRDGMIVAPCASLNN
jgi:hypothetical protein